MTSQLAERQTSASLPTGRGKGPGGQPFLVPPPLDGCPVPGCGDLIDATRLMCSRDWNLLPKRLRDRVWATWRSGHGAASREHQQAVRQAIAAARAARLPGWKRQLSRLLLPLRTRIVVSAAGHRSIEPTGTGRFRRHSFGHR
jgi:hypothetical protein